MFSRGQLTLRAWGNVRLQLSQFSSSVDAALTRPIVQKISYPGSRVLRLARPETGNYLSLAAMNYFERSLKVLQDTDTVAAVMFSSYDPTIFSKGLDHQEWKEQLGVVTKQLHTLSNAISEYTKPTLAVYMGRASGTSYATFASSKVMSMSFINNFSLELMSCIVILMF